MEAAVRHDVFGAGLRSEIERRNDGFVAFLPSPRGYGLVERIGPAPAVGTLLEDDGTVFRVIRLGRSPLPRDGRRCAFFEAV
ncbi:MAG TPA: hypothetical protein VFR32_07315 [Gaiellaceae bacterium]|nr:hypothetical protein [Gaiellaceae bacterium]